MSPQSHATVRQVGCQAPGFLFADSPVDQQVGENEAFNIGEKSPAVQPHKQR
jgi:hypothetical protein